MGSEIDDVQVKRMALRLVKALDAELVELQRLSASGHLLLSVDRLAQIRRRRRQVAEFDDLAYQADWPGDFAEVYR